MKNIRYILLCIFFLLIPTVPNIIAQNSNIVITSVVISPDGTMMAGTGSEGFLRIWDIATGNLIIDLTNQSDNTQELILDMAWSPDGRRIAASGMKINFIYNQLASHRIKV